MSNIEIIDITSYDFFLKNNALSGTRLSGSEITEFHSYLQKKKSTFLNVVKQQIKRYLQKNKIKIEL